MRRLGNLAHLTVAWTLWGIVCAFGRIVEYRLPEFPDTDDPTPEELG